MRSVPFRSYMWCGIFNSIIISSSSIHHAWKLSNLPLFVWENNVTKWERKKDIEVSRRFVARVFLIIHKSRQVYIYVVCIYVYIIYRKWHLLIFIHVIFIHVISFIFHIANFTVNNNNGKGQKSTLTTRTAIQSLNYHYIYIYNYESHFHELAIQDMAYTPLTELCYMKVYSYIFCSYL